MTPRRSVYPVTNEIIQWLNHSQLYPVEESVFRYFQTLSSLASLIDRAEAGLISKYAARSALREYNEENKTAVTYDEIRDRSFNHLLADVGEWAAYTDRPHLLLSSGDPELTMLYPHEMIDWVVTWYPMKNIVVVFKSPYLGNKQPLRLEESVGGVQELFSEGLQRGQLLSYTIPAEIEAAVGYLTDEELEYSR